MERVFVMTAAFDRSWREIGLDDSDLLALQDRLLVDPSAGEIIQGTGGARKIRVSARTHGTRGGARVIYVDIVVADQIYLLAAYAKNKRTDLTDHQKKEIRDLIRILKETPNGR